MVLKTFLRILKDWNDNNNCLEKSPVVQITRIPRNRLGALYGIDVTLTNRTLVFIFQKLTWHSGSTC